MDKKLLDKLMVAISDQCDVRANEPMSAHTTFKCGGPVSYFVEPLEPESVPSIIRAAKMADAPWHVIGCGSNLLISDDGLEGVVICFGDKMSKITVEDTKLIAQAGATNLQVAQAAHAHGLAGYEFASGIPGSIGGAAFMNAGAYDGEFKDVAVSVTCLTPDGDVVEVSRDEADWSYRHSMMQDSGYVVLSATLQLEHGNQKRIQEIMDDLKARRESKQPLELGSAGSTFKRPEGYFAGKLIQDSGLMGHTVGGAQVSTKHAGFVVNTGTATAADVRNVIDDVQRTVFDKFGVQLEPEVRMWGFVD